jgi:hypothetical protein
MLLGTLLYLRFTTNPHRDWHIARYADEVWHRRETHHRHNVAPADTSNHFLMRPSR